MNVGDVKTAAEVTKILSERQMSHVKIGVTDIDGVLRGKYMSREKFLSALEKGFGFCDVVLGWDSQDRMYDNVKITGWHTGYGDAWVRVLPDSCTELPLEDNMLFFLGEFSDKAEAVCPRGVLRRVLQRAESMGLQAKAGFEYEFFVFDESSHSIRDKHYRNLQPMDRGAFGYSVIRNTVHAGFYQGLLKLCETMDMPIEGLHEETGPGVMEAALAASGALQAADRASRFKTFTKVFAQQNHRLATFMAKWSPDWPGQSGHIHISLTNADGQHVFHDAARAHGMSTMHSQFVAGQQKFLPELLAMVAPTVNSYTRLIPGYWAPTDSSWGVENRTCALRVIPGSPSSQRVEYRIAAADANPYLALAAALASGLEGIAAGLTPPEPVTGNAYDKQFPEADRLPASLGEAAGRLRRSDMAKAAFGEAFVDHFAATREWEQREFQRHITDWELKRYLEII